MASSLDELDLKIIKELQDNSRLSITDLAKKVDSSRPTVTSRLKRLIDEKFISLKTGLDSKKMNFMIACVGLEVKTDDSRIKLEGYLTSCPRVLNIFRTSEKANLHLSVWGEDDQTIKSTIESFRDFPNVDLVYTHYLGTPIHGNLYIPVMKIQTKETPCGKTCKTCHRFTSNWCIGCPVTPDYAYDYTNPPR